MIIRSQDETLLVDLSEKVLQAQRGNVYVISLGNTNPDNNYLEVANYKTQETAIEVMDEIVNRHNALNTHVFQMPQEVANDTE